jgi:hypothetical protein
MTREQLKGRGLVCNPACTFYLNAIEALLRLKIDLAKGFAIGCVGAHACSDFIPRNVVPWVRDAPGR